jgi:hypothetical protein
MNVHDGPVHGGGALTTCRLCRAIANDIVLRALGLPTRYPLVGRFAVLKRV